MDKKESFGEISAQDLNIGDIVEWSTWNMENNNWKSNYGIIMEIKNEIKGNRMVSVSIVVPLTGPRTEIKLFTPSLRLVSKVEAVNGQ